METHGHVRGARADPNLLITPLATAIDQNLAFYYLLKLSTTSTEFSSTRIRLVRTLAAGLIGHMG